jgi:catechol 2,3-dioxygenase-like lactoylglutathione lyase family enzyme
VSGGFHHVELWVPALDRALPGWSWLMTSLGWAEYQSWENGRSWRHDDAYLVIEASPDMRPEPHDRLRPGLNHVALHAGTRADVDRLTEAAADHGWSLMFADKHPYAGGPDHYAAFLEDADGYEVELVAA